MRVRGEVNKSKKKPSDSRTLLNCKNKCVRDLTNAYDTGWRGGVGEGTGKRGFT
jgi:hypothetical protein